MHALRSYFIQKKIEGSIISYINRKRREQFLKERDEQEAEKKED